MDSLLDFSGTVEERLYRWDRECVLQDALCRLAATQGDDADLVRAIENLPVPSFPVKAADVMKNGGLQPGPEVGKELKRLERLWINSGFRLSREELLARAD